eukprot:6444669-Amphidinium_carterae.1
MTLEPTAIRPLSRRYRVLGYGLCRRPIAHAAVQMQIVQIASHNFTRPLGSAIVMLYGRKLGCHCVHWALCSCRQNCRR